MKRASVAAFIFLGISCGAVFGSPADPPTSITLTSAFRKMDGSYINGMPVADLSVVEDGKASGQIVSVERMSGVPRDFCIVLGQNQQTKERFDYEQALALKFLHEIVEPKTDEVSLIVYNANTVGPGTSSARKSIADALSKVTWQSPRENPGNGRYNNGLQIDGRSNGEVLGSWYSQVANGVYTRANLDRFVEAAPLMSDGGMGMAVVRCATWFAGQRRPEHARFIALFADENWGTASVSVDLTRRILLMNSIQVYAFGFNDGSRPAKAERKSSPPDFQQHVNRALSYLASQTGGAAYYVGGNIKHGDVPSLTEIRNRFDNLLRIQYAPAAKSQFDSEMHTIVLKYAPDKLVRVNAPASFYTVQK